METEQQLLGAIRNGEQSALRRLYDRYSGFAMAIGLRYIPEPDEVKDVLQDSFVKIFTSIDSFEFRGEGSLKNWVARIVANKAIDYVRHREHLVFGSEMPEDIVDEEEDISGVTADMLMGMIGGLPSKYRLVLNLYVFEQLSHKEIGRQLGIKENTSASIYFRARRMLGEMIREYLKEQEI